MLLKRLSIRHMRDTWRVVNIYILPSYSKAISVTVFLARLLCMTCIAIDLTLNVTRSPLSIHSRVNLTVLFLCSSISASYCNVQAFRSMEASKDVWVKPWIYLTMLTCMQINYLPVTPTLRSRRSISAFLKNSLRISWEFTLGKST